MKLVWHEKPDEAIIKICRDLDQVRRKDGQAMYWGLVRRHLLQDPWFLMRVALEWTWLDDDLVGNKFIKHLATNWGEDVGVLFPRGHGKTLPFSGLAVSAIINDPNIAILQMSRTDGNAEKIGGTIARHLMENDFLQQCFARKHWDKGFLPSALSDCNEWGKDGYRLPWLKPRIDPTLLSLSLKGAKAGKHPDIIWLDDLTEKENNDENGWNAVIETVRQLWFLPNAAGFMWWSATRWHDADPVGLALRGKLTGKQGPFKFIQESCYVDDMPEKGATYPHKIRWSMTVPSGYTLEALDRQRQPEPEGLGTLFDAQMRNDPSPQERAQIKVDDIIIYKPEEMPKLSGVKLMGIETTGGGLPIFNGFQEHLDKLKINLPLVEITNPKKQGVEKADRIVAALQPIVDSGRLAAQQWMIGEKHASEGLGYELRRIGKALHDDVADALHNVPVNLAKGLTPPRPDLPADLYISVDLAWTEKKRADWTVIMAVAVDHKGNHWVVDYDRFQISSPTGIYTRLLEFYRKFDDYVSLRQLSPRKHPGAWR